MQAENASMDFAVVLGGFELCKARFSIPRATLSEECASKLYEEERILHLQRRRT